MRKALVIGGGAREHAIAARLAEEGWAVSCAPGNAGIAKQLRCLPFDIGDLGKCLALARAERPDLAVVGPEAPLIAGLADMLAAEGILAFGPSAAAARIEGSKAFAKEVMVAAKIPTATHAVFEDAHSAFEHARALGGRLVVKVDGIAAGKGVVVCSDVAEARQAIEAALVHGEFGAAGRRLVLEERLEGRELSLMAVCDGARYQLLPLSQDYKRVGDGDRGPNTGGMGAVSPPAYFVRPERSRGPNALEEPALSLPKGPSTSLGANGGGFDASALGELAIAPALERLRAIGSPFRGVLYAGLMLTPQGPKVLEYNCRLGDPETQVLMERIDGALGEAMAASARGDLGGCKLAERPGAAVGVVACAEGYPRTPRLGDDIRGIDDAACIARIRCGGVGGSPERPTTRGGRVLTVVGSGADLAAARAQAYRALAFISFEGKHYRSDIGA
jgi:phosphoribosylamine--glycine ligase